MIALQQTTEGETKEPIYEAVESARVRRRLNAGAANAEINENFERAQNEFSRLNPAPRESSSLGANPGHALQIAP
jgi:hypothetical protein